MNFLAFLIIPVIAVIIVSAIMSRIYRDEEKKDKGFVLFYHKFTYRRRMIRALWGIPIMFLSYLVLYWLDNFTSNEKITIGIIFLLIVLIEIAYNYVKWKKIEKKYNPL
ncbi:hypothetical protein ACFSTA_00285 [Ornithinibacillus salinisoli]|uniref:ATPase n=1 Tax=Ornithinibacillus salinisoli TaxID=1848459 RepID=A0ABW4VSW4_9BACI